MREKLADNEPFRFVPPGKYLRFPLLFQREAPLIMCPVDDFLIFGARNGLQHADKKIKAIVDAKPDAILTFAGAISRAPEIFLHSRYILNLTASTVRSFHTRKVRSHTIEEALRLNASGVAAHINMRSQYATEMIDLAGEIVCEARRYEIPTIGIIYPRGESGGNDDNMEEIKMSDNTAFAEIVAHCVALGADLGFDAIKTFYTDNADSFQTVVNASCGIPLLIAGGPCIDENSAIDLARNAVGAGASGVSFGRNVFGRSDPGSFLYQLRQAISV